MPDCIGDSKLLKKSLADNKIIVQNATKSISNAAGKLKANCPTKDGLGIFYHMAGLFGQRLWFYYETKNYTHKLKIDKIKCIGCGKCVKLCPMNNITLNGNKAIALNKCTKCYRCISNCPTQSITLLGSTLLQQSKIEKYI